jgi:hypothetical protein
MVSRRSQLIPIISKDPAVAVVNFARTAMWHVPGVRLSLEENGDTLLDTYTRSTADRPLLEGRNMGIFSHTALASYPSLHDRDTGAPCMRPS